MDSQDKNGYYTTHYFILPGVVVSLEMLLYYTQWEP